MVRRTEDIMEQARERMAVLRAAHSARLAIVLGTPHVVATTNCRNCGAPPSAGVGACRYCGTPHGVYAPTTTHPSASPWRIRKD